MVAIRRAWRAFWQPWRIAFAVGAITGMSTMYVVDHPSTPLRSVVGILVAIGVLPWIAMLISPRRDAGRDEVRYSGPGRGVQIVRTEGLPEGYVPPSGALIKQEDDHGTEEYVPVIEVMGIEVHVDPAMPPDRIEIRDPETGEVRAYWGEHGVFEVLPPRPWRPLGRTTDGGEMWTAPIGTPPPGDATEARTS